MRMIGVNPSDGWDVAGIFVGPVEDVLLDGLPPITGSDALQRGSSH